MDRTHDFLPRWASPPGGTIQDALEEQGLSQAVFAKSIGVSRSQLTGLLSGKEMLSIELARRISRSIGGSVEFWLTRDGQYRDDLTRVAADQWAESLPITQMAGLGWIDKPTDWRSRITSCLEFFDVPDLPEWQRTYGAMLEGARFRISDKAGVNVNATSVWLRQAEIEAARLSCVPWDRDAFESSLADLRPLTRISDPKRFAPALVSRCAAAGVAVVVLRAPAGCPTNGVARYLAPGRPHIALSARYLSDDHFWFTFFHEVGHLLLHDPQVVYVDEIDQRVGRPASNEEREADDFATNVLVPAPVRERLLWRRPTPAQLHQLANEAGISSGILVGQLQHAGVIGFDSVLNRLKRRYQWVGSSLERA